ncbi:MAG: capsular biosynthesis protein [Sphingomicrobium sp.]
MTAEPRAFVFLQGPPGPLFLRLAEAMRAGGVRVERINLSGGDRYDWPEGATQFTGRFAEWPAFFDRFVREHGTTDLLLFGDCRPYHMAAHGIAAARDIRIHVLEEGYLRPDWMTLERDGVNARSTLSRDKQSFLAEGRILPPEEELPPVTASFKRRARDSYWYYHHVLVGSWRYPHYRSHRTTPILAEGFGWLWRLAGKQRREREADRVVAPLADKPFFLFPLQLSGDYQIRMHSCFPDMQSAACFAIESFAQNAPADTHLLLKVHPLDSSFFNWSGLVKQEARRLGIEDRLHYIDGGNLDELSRSARGVVCVNSTSATVALAQGTPVRTLGEAIYDLQGLTHQGHLDGFWAAPEPPEPAVYPAFRNALVNRCLVRGGLASESAVAVLVGSIIERLGLAS